MRVHQDMHLASDVKLLDVLMRVSNTNLCYWDHSKCNDVSV
jgi:hypothetical protein